MTGLFASHMKNFKRKLKDTEPSTAVPERISLG